MLAWRVLNKLVMAGLLHSSGMDMLLTYVLPCLTQHAPPACAALRKGPFCKQWAEPPGNCPADTAWSLMHLAFWHSISFMRSMHAALNAAL